MVKKDVINIGFSLNNKEERPHRHPVQRAPSRLYRAAVPSKEVDSRAKYCCPNTCIGPEFIVRATKPSKVIHLKGVRDSCRKKVVVILLNGQKIDVSCDPNITTAGQIFEVVVISEEFEDNFTLGLAALLDGDFAFIPHETKLYKVAPAGWRGDNKKHILPSFTFTLYLRVKFFLPSLRGIRYWTMKHLLYLQLRRSLLEQQIQCDMNQHVSLSGLALQSEFGDYSDQEHGSGDYFLLEHYIPESLLTQHEDGNSLKTRMKILHKERCGLDPGRAEEIYITLVQMMKGYSSHYYNAIWETKDGTNREMLLEINSQGLTLHESHCNERQVYEFFVWKKIQLLSYSKQYLFITPQNDNKGTNKPTKYKLHMNHKKSFFVFHLASFHHQISMKLRSDVNSLQSLTAEFGVSIKNYLGRENKLYQVENNENNTLHRQHVFVTPALALSANSKRIQNTVKQKTITGSHAEMEVNGDNVASFNKSSEPSHCLESINIEEHQNKENENPVSMREGCRYMSKNENRKATKMGSSSRVPGQNVYSTLLRNTVNNFNDTNTIHRVKVKMGTKVFGEVQKENNSSQKTISTVSTSQAPEISSQSSVQDVYVLNSSIKSAEEKFEVDFQESLSESLLEKFDSVACKEERMLRVVKIKRDECGTLGLQITEGSDRGLYVQSVLPDGPASSLGTVHRGDQLIAMDGHSLLNLNYEEAMDLFRCSGTEVEIVLSQIIPDTESYETLSKPRDINESRDYDALEMPVTNPKLSDHGESAIESDCGEKHLVPNLNVESSGAVPVEDFYLNSIRYEVASEGNSGGRDSEMMSTPIATPIKRRREHQQTERHDGIRAVCCVHAEDD
ncbi:hypothetical protein ANN_15816 [Periplaneta americana]|uniref:Tyrosine-protein phosphatase non-receptor type 13 n=1 Tax=Periplaneta americana TaxID=6978 RepID=A0ABQ8SIM0_PERAM|nr:hypothetical protein ANN_15816 [Periplaneta americana]